VQSCENGLNLGGLDGLIRATSSASFSLSRLVFARLSLLPGNISSDFSGEPKEFV
jgi:hypothetical protein